MRWFYFLIFLSVNLLSQNITNTTFKERPRACYYSDQLFNYEKNYAIATVTVYTFIEHILPTVAEILISFVLPIVLKKMTQNLSNAPTNPIEGGGAVVPIGTTGNPNSVATALNNIGGGYKLLLNWAYRWRHRGSEYAENKLGSVVAGAILSAGAGNSGTATPAVADTSTTPSALTLFTAVSNLIFSLAYLAANAECGYQEQ